MAMWEFLWCNAQPGKINEWKKLEGSHGWGWAYKNFNTWAIRKKELSQNQFELRLFVTSRKEKDRKVTTE